MNDAPPLEKHLSLKKKIVLKSNEYESLQNL